jgi:hypothetical protein
MKAAKVTAALNVAHNRHEFLGADDFSFPVLRQIVLWCAVDTCRWLVAEGNWVPK